MRRSFIVFGIFVAAVATGCFGDVPGPTQQANQPYAVVYGRIGAPANAINVTAVIVAYADSMAALKDSSLAVRGGASVAADSNSFITAVTATKPVTYWINVFATGQDRHGFVSSLDTARALRVRFDSIGGGPHDSVAVYDSLP